MVASERAEVIYDVIIDVNVEDNDFGDSASNRLQVISPTHLRFH